MAEAVECVREAARLGQDCVPETEEEAEAIRTAQVRLGVLTEEPASR